MQEFEFYTRLIENKPFVIAVDRFSADIKTRMGLRLYLYDCSYDDTHIQVAFDRKLHDLIQQQKTDTVFIHSYIPDNKYDYALSSDYFKAIKYDVVNEVDFIHFWKS